MLLPLVGAGAAPPGYDGRGGRGWGWRYALPLCYGSKKMEFVKNSYPPPFATKKGPIRVKISIQPWGPKNQMLLGGASHRNMRMIFVGPLVLRSGCVITTEIIELFRALSSRDDTPAATPYF